MDDDTSSLLRMTLRIILVHYPRDATRDDLECPTGQRVPEGPSARCRTSKLLVRKCATWGGRIVSKSKRLPQSYSAVTITHVAQAPAKRTKCGLESPHYPEARRRGTSGSGIQWYNPTRTSNDKASGLLPASITAKTSKGRLLPA